MVGNSHANRPQHARLEALLELWRARYGTAPLPERSRFGPADLQPWAPYIARIELTADARYRVVGFGIELIRRFGREATGHCVEDLAPDIATGLRGRLQESFQSGRPVFGSVSIPFGHHMTRFADLILPLSANPSGPNRFLVASYEIRSPPP